MIDILSLATDASQSGSSVLFDCAVSVDVGEWTAAEGDEVGGMNRPIAATTAGSMMAVARGSNILIMGPKDGSLDPNCELDVCAEVEFETSSVSAACWGPSSDSDPASRNRCLVVGDDSGSVHFLLARTGEVIFSKKLVQAPQASKSPSCILAQFGFGETQNSLVTAFSNGKVIVFHKLSLDKLISATTSSDRSIYVQEVLKGLLIKQFNISPKSEGIVKLSIVSIDEDSVQVVYLEKSGALAFADLRGETRRDQEPASEIALKFQDIAALSSASIELSNYVLGLTKDGRLLLLTIRGGVNIVSSCFLPASSISRSAQCIAFVKKLDCVENGAEVSLFLIGVTFDGGVQSLSVLCVNGSLDDPKQGFLFVPLNTTVLKKGDEPFENTDAPLFVSASGPPSPLCSVSYFYKSELQVFRLNQFTMLEYGKFFESYNEKFETAHLTNDEVDYVKFCGRLLRKVNSFVSVTEIIEMLKFYVGPDGTMLEAIPNIAFITYCIFYPCNIAMCEELLQFLLASTNGASAFLQSIKKYCATASNSNKIDIIKGLCAGYASRRLDCVLVASVDTLPPSYNAWLSLISEGKFLESKVVLSLFFDNSWPKLNSSRLLRILSMATEAVENRPYLVHELIDWVECSLLEAVRKSNFIPNTSISEDCSTICRTLIKLAIHLQTLFTEPFSSLVCSSYIFQLASRHYPRLLDEEIVVPVDENDSLSVSVTEFHTALTIQSSIWLRWKIEVSLQEVVSSGINGLALNRLWDISETSPATLSHKIVTDVKPLVLEFGGDMDAVLVDWIASAISSAKISFQDQKDCDDNVHFFSLIECAGLIANSNATAKVIKDLIYLASSQTIVNLDTGKRQNMMSLLIEIAERTHPSLNSGIEKDSLLEAVRILKLRRIALNYGVSDFDVRNVRQIRSVVKAIGTCHRCTNSILDCIDFANGWNALHAEIGYILGHCLVSRALAKDDSSKMSGNSEVKHVLEIAFTQIPAGKLAIAAESAINAIADRITSIVAKLRFHQVKHDLELHKEIQILCNGAIAIVSLFLDQTSPIVMGSSILSTSIGVDNPSKFDVKTRIVGAAESKIITSALLSSLKRVRLLQLEGIFVSIDEVSSVAARKEVAKTLASERSEEIVKSGIHSAALNPRCRNVCTILEVPSILFTHFIVQGLLKSNEFKLALLHAAQKDDDIQNNPSYRSQELVTHVDDVQFVMRTCVSLCFALMKQSKSLQSKEKVEYVRCIFTIVHQTLKKALLTCSRSTIGSALSSLSSADLVLSITERVDTGIIVPNSSSTFLDTSPVFTAFARDGILLAADSVLPMLKACLSELQFRGVEIANATSTREVTFSDLSDFSSILLKTENYLLSSRILLSSWMEFPKKSQLLQMSFLNMSRKLLGYRDIDISLAIACLAAVPYDILVRELKQAVPSTQRDFARLQTVASIGEDLSRLWDQEDLLGIFQSLQTNAKWWHILATYGIKIDPKAFQSSISIQRENCIRSVVPDLLTRSGLDLDLAIEYCCQFDIEGAFATLCYIEQIMLAPLSSPADIVWVKLVKGAMSMLEERSLVRVFYDLLPRIHPLDYEKVRFISSWLIQTLNEDLKLIDALSGGLDRVSILKRLQSFVDLITVMQGIVFSDLSIIAPIFSYDDVSRSSEYNYRIPLWPLVNDTWEVLTPVLAKYPHYGNKLSLMCNALSITVDDFHEQRIMASTNICPSYKTDALRWVSGEPIVEMSIVLEKIAEFRSNVLVISDPCIRLRLWYWAVHKELLHHRWDIVELLLTSIVDEISSLPETYASPSCYEAKIGLYAAMARLHIRKAVFHITNCVSDSDSSEIENVILLNDGNNSDRALKALLLRLNEGAWAKQYGSLHYYDGGSVSAEASLFSTFDICNSRICEEVFVYVSKCSRQISIAFEKSFILDKLILPSQDGIPLQAEEALENMRMSFALKLMYDGVTCLSTENQPSEHVDSDHSVSSAKSASTSWAGLLGSQSSFIYPTAADERRRIDIFLGFVLSILLLTCDRAQRDSMVECISGIANNSPRFAKSKRITARSRFRAIQALSFVPKEWCVFSAGLWRLLFCLSEVQEMRLSCSEDTLIDALGCRTSTPATSNVSHDVKSNCRLLIRTLLRDEGHQSSVSELCRDILICMSQVFQPDADAWDEVLSHMVLQGHDRAFLDAIISLRHLESESPAILSDKSFANNSVTLRRLFSSKILYEGLLRSLESFCTGCMQKIEQVTEVAMNRVRGESNKLPGFCLSRIVLRNFMTNSPWAISNWDEAPENLWLCVEQLGLLSRLLITSIADQSHSEDCRRIMQYVRSTSLVLSDAHLKLKSLYLDQSEGSTVSGDGALVAQVIGRICYSESIAVAVAGLAMQSSSSVDCDNIHILMQSSKRSQAVVGLSTCSGVWNVAVNFALLSLPYHLLSQIFDHYCLDDPSYLAEVCMDLALSTAAIGKNEASKDTNAKLGVTHSVAVSIFQWCFSRDDRMRTSAEALSQICVGDRSKLLVLLKSLSSYLIRDIGVSEIILKRCYSILGA